MTLFQYKAIPLSGSHTAMRRGEIAGESASAVRASLRKLGLQVIKIQPLTTKTSTPWFGKESLQGHLRKKRRLQRAEMYDSLATMLDSGLPLLEALDTVASARGGQSSLRATLLTMRESVRSGRSFGEAMRDHGSWFDILEIAMVEAGQHSGGLIEVLRALAERHERSGELSHKLLSALAYPAVVAAVGFFVLIFLSTKTLPDLSAILGDANVSIPPLTDRVMAVGQGIARFWWLLALIGVTIGFVWTGGRVLMRRRGWEPPRAWVSWTPSLNRRLAVASFAKRMAELLRCGVPLVEALRVAAPTMKSAPFRMSLLDSAKKVERGDDLSKALDNDLWFDAEFVRLLEIGEAAGELEDVFQRTAERYERRSRRLIDRLASLLEPAVILTLAALIGIVVMAAILPVLKLQEIL